MEETKGDEWRTIVGTELHDEKMRTKPINWELSKSSSRAEDIAWRRDAVEFREETKVDDEKGLRR